MKPYLRDHVPQKLSEIPTQPLLKLDIWSQRTPVGGAGVQSSTEKGVWAVCNAICTARMA